MGSIGGRKSNVSGREGDRGDRGDRGDYEHYEHYSNDGFADMAMNVGERSDRARVQARRLSMALHQFQVEIDKRSQIL